MSNTTPALSIHQQRAAFFAASVFTSNLLPNTTSINPGGVTSISIPAQGVLTSIDLIVTLNVTNSGANAASPQYGAPYSAITNIKMKDQQQLERLDISGLGLYKYLSFNNPPGVGLFDASFSPAEGGALVPSYPSPSIPDVAAGANGVITFPIHIPISMNNNSTEGAIQVSNNVTAALPKVELTIPAVVGGNATFPYNNAVTVTGGTVQVIYNSWVQTQNIPAGYFPTADFANAIRLVDSISDSTNIIPGGTKQIDLQLQFVTDLVGITYYNGSSYEQGGDLNSIIFYNGIMTVDNKPPSFHFQRYRRMHGVDGFPGTYFFDFRANPLTNQTVGLYKVLLNFATVNAGAQTTQFYRYYVPSGSNVAGPTQIG